MAEQSSSHAGPSAPENLELLQAVIDKAEMGIAVLRLPDLVFELANPAFQEFALGRQVVGRTIGEVFPNISDTLGPLETIARELREPWRRDDQPFEVRRGPEQAPDVMYVSLEAHPLTVRGRDYVVVTALDRTVRVRLRQQLEAEREQQREEDQVRLRFAECLDEINAVIHSSLHYDEIMQRALEEGTKALGARAGSVFVGVGEDHSEAKYVYGFPKALVGRRFAASEFPLSALMEKHKQPVAVGPSEMRELMNPTLARLFGVRSIMAIPLAIRGNLVGGIGIVFREPHEFTRPEVEFSSGFGASVSRALENADLYERQERLASTLQSALLTLPERVPGLSFAHAYHSATQEARVGGDFFDVFELDHDAVGITIGDIAGHGVEASVLTSLVKNAIRVQAARGDVRPHEVLSITNELLLASSPDDVFASVFFGVLHVGADSLEFCNAGHPAGIRVRPDGRIGLLAANSPVIGALADQSYYTSVEPLEPRDTLFLYSDGLTEARCDGEFFGEARLIDVLSRSSTKHPRTMVKRAVGEALLFSNGELADDMAVLALRRNGYTKRSR